MKYTLDLDIKNEKAKALLRYISTLDFVKVSEFDGVEEVGENEYVGYSYSENKPLTKQDVVNRSENAVQQYKKGKYTTHEAFLKESENW